VNLSELIADVRSRADEDTADFWTNSMLTTWLNQASLELAFRLENLEEMDTQNTTSGTANYTLPSDCIKLLRVQVDSLPLRPITFSRLDAFETKGSPSTDTEGTPEWFYLWKDQIYVYPTPSESVTSGLKILYVKRPAAMSADEDEPDHPEQFHHLLALYALYRALQRDMMYSQARDVLQEWLDEIDVARMSLADEQRVGPLQIQYIEE